MYSVLKNVYIVYIADSMSYYMPGHINRLFSCSLNRVFLIKSQHFQAVFLLRSQHFQQFSSSEVNTSSSFPPQKSAIPACFPPQNSVYPVDMYRGLAMSCSLMAALVLLLLATSVVGTGGK